MAQSRQNPPTPSQHGRRRQTLAESLLLTIFQGRFRPGDHLVLRELSELFGVSATPIREALITLAGVGIVDLLPNRGAVVRQVSAREVRDICQVRKALECEAIRAACGRIDQTELNDLAQAFRELLNTRNLAGQPGVEQARSLDSRLHDLIAASCGNALLVKELNRLKMLFRTFRDVAWEQVAARNDYHRLHEEAQEHLAIIEALLTGDRRAAMTAMARHIRAGGRYWTRVKPVSSEQSEV